MSGCSWVTVKNMGARGRWRKGVVLIQLSLELGFGLAELFVLLLELRVVLQEGSSLLSEHSIFLLELGDFLFKAALFLWIRGMTIRVRWTAGQVTLGYGASLVLVAVVVA